MVVVLKSANRVAGRLFVDFSLLKSVSLSHTHILFSRQVDALFCTISIGSMVLSLSLASFSFAFNIEKAPCLATDAKTVRELPISYSLPSTVFPIHSPSSSCYLPKAIFVCDRSITEGRERELLYKPGLPNTRP